MEGLVALLSSLSPRALDARHLELTGGGGGNDDVRL